MYLSEKQLKKYTCKIEKKFYLDFINEYNYMVWYDQIDGEQLYDTNHMLEFLLGYPDVNDKSKQYYYFMCKKVFNDIPPLLVKKYNIKFGLFNCGNQIHNSYGCSNSNLLINCNDIKNSFGCNKCKFSDHLLYCTDKRHKSYMAFNKEISKARFNELIKISPEKLKDEPEYDDMIYNQINSLMEYIYRFKDVT